MRDPRIEALFGDFLLETRERLDHLEALLLAAVDAGQLEGERLDDVRLELHTLKGNAGLVGLGDLQAEAHRLEDLIAELAPGDEPPEELLGAVDRLRHLLQQAVAGEAGAGAPSPGEGTRVQASVRIAFATLDALVSRLEQMVILRNRLTEALERHREELGEQARSAPFEAVRQTHDDLGTTLGFLRDDILRLRMVPLATLFGSLRRIVHDEAVRLGKEVALETAGGETPLDRGLLEVASEALGHLVRNAVIHGLETTEERRRLGKPRATVRVAAETDTREVRILVLDDGRGIRRDEILAAAVRRGDEVPAGGDPFSLLFAPGFSTRAETDLGAGRGIGLAAVQEAVNRRGGRIEVFSEEGLGTLFRLHLPLSVSIIRALLIASDGEEYALPLGTMEETFRFASDQVHVINGGMVIERRGRLVPLLDLGFCFGTSPVRRRHGYGVALAAEGGRRILGVESIQGIREVVVNPLDPLVSRHPAVAGSTILGDGRAVLLLDPTGLARLSPLADPGSVM